MVNFKSGLFGVSETSSDMRELLEREARDVRAAEAIALFCYQRIGAFAAALGGLDTLVFAGGSGENAPTIRTRICEGLEFLGIELDEQQNPANEGMISAPASRVAVRVIPTDEEGMIAKMVCCVLGLCSKKGELNHEDRNSFPGTGPNSYKHPFPRSAPQDGRLLARRQLSVGRPDLSL
jgi:acetate kinase